GSQGVLFSDTPGSHTKIPAEKVSAVDTTAAGDAFTGALAAALGSGKSFVEAAQFASTAAALSVARMGAQPSLPTLEEVLQKMGTVRS
ncbi:MAG: PfkB family carbohydrate kinase, partial [Planctomycetia bacterium]|nr:PfkB family carbohydrate kinase [Planctomycetia bacterium]